MAFLAWAERPVERPVAEVIANRLAELGDRYRLLLAIGGEAVIDFADRDRMTAYLAGQGP